MLFPIEARLINQVCFEMFRFSSTHGGDCKPVYDFYSNYVKECRDRCNEYIDLHASKTSEIKNGDFELAKPLRSKISVFKDVIRNYGQRLENVQIMWRKYPRETFTSPESYYNFNDTLLSDLEWE